MASTSSDAKLDGGLAARLGTSISGTAGRSLFTELEFSVTMTSDGSSEARLGCGVGKVSVEFSSDSEDEVLCGISACAAIFNDSPA